MDFERLFERLCDNFKDFMDGIITEEVMDRYIKGVFDTLDTLGLMEQYNAWCETHGISTEEIGEED